MPPQPPGPEPAVAVEADRTLEPPAPVAEWIRTRTPTYWAWQVLAYLAAVTVDSLLGLATIDHGRGLAQEPWRWIIVLVIVVGNLPLIGRRRWSSLAFASSWITTMVITLAIGSQSFLGVLIALHAVAATQPARRARTALLLGLAPGLVQAYDSFQLQGEEAVFSDFLIPAVFFSALSLLLFLFGRHDYRSRLAAAALRREVTQTAHEATAQERQRIARELHDILSHSVSAMMMQAAGARALTQRIRESVDGTGDAAGTTGTSDDRLATVERSLTTIEQTGSESLRELHRLLEALREDPGPGQDSSAEAMATDHAQHLDLHALIADRQDDLTIQHEHQGDHRRLDPSVSTAAYRVVQESLTNALKHAGRGAAVEVREIWTDTQLHLQVRSRPGHDVPSTAVNVPGSGTGLLGLKERVELVGGSFESGWIRSEFVTTAILPLTGSPS